MNNHLGAPKHSEHMPQFHFISRGSNNYEMGLSYKDYSFYLP